MNTESKARPPPYPIPKTETVSVPYRSRNTAAADCISALTRFVVVVLPLDKSGTSTTHNKNVEDDNPTAVMAVFAGDDILLGATREDAALLNDVLGKNDAVKDHLVKIFPGQAHGFAHLGISNDNNDDNNNMD